MAHDYGVTVLGSLPLDIRIREQADSGQPDRRRDPDSRARRSGDRRKVRSDRRERRTTARVSQDRHQNT